MTDEVQLRSAYQSARRELLAARSPQGHWIGRLSDAASATAAVAIALSRFAKKGSPGALREAASHHAARATEWLARRQHADGGWSDAPGSASDAATTLLAVSALRLVDAAPCATQSMDRADAYLAAQGGAAAIRRAGVGSVLPVAALAAAALSGALPWREVPALPFEITVIPPRFRHAVRMPLASEQLPALIALGRLAFWHRPPRFPLRRLARHLAWGRSLARLAEMQSSNGSFCDAVFSTALVVASVVLTSAAESPLITRAVSYLLAAMRSDGASPPLTDRAVANTAHAAAAFATASGDVGALGGAEWLLARQRHTTHPVTQATVGGWGASGQDGAPPDSATTAAVLVALSALKSSATEASRAPIDLAAAAAVAWLLTVQNRDGGWPLYVRGGSHPLDLSAADVTAAVLAALRQWSTAAPTRINSALARGTAFLERAQRGDGSWLGRCYGNRNGADEANPIAATACIVKALGDLGRGSTPIARRGFAWLAAAAGADGGWGGNQRGEISANAGGNSSVVETAMAVEALPGGPRDAVIGDVIDRGLNWLIDAVRSGSHHQTAPIVRCDGGLLCDEQLLPLIHGVAALGRAMRSVSATESAAASPSNEAER